MPVPASVPVPMHVAVPMNAGTPPVWAGTGMPFHPYEGEGRSVAHVPGVQGQLPHPPQGWVGQPSMQGQFPFVVGFREHQHQQQQQAMAAFSGGVRMSGVGGAATPSPSDAGGGLGGGDARGGEDGVRQGDGFGMGVEEVDGKDEESGVGTGMEVGTGVGVGPLYKRPFRCVTKSHDACGLGGMELCTCTAPPKNRASDNLFVLLSSDDKVKGSTRLRTLVSTLSEWRSRKEHDLLVRHLTKLLDKYDAGWAERAGVEQTIAVLKSHLIRKASKSALFEMCRAWGIKSCIWQHKDVAKKAAAAPLNLPAARSANGPGVFCPIPMGDLTSWGGPLVQFPQEGEAVRDKGRHDGELPSVGGPSSSLMPLAPLYGEAVSRFSKEDVENIFSHRPNIQLDMTLSFDIVHTSRVLQYISTGTKIQELQVAMVLDLYLPMMTKDHPAMPLLLTAYFGGRPPSVLPEDWRSKLMLAWNRRIKFVLRNRTSCKELLAKIDTLCSSFLHRDGEWNEAGFSKAARVLLDDPGMLARINRCRLELGEFAEEISNGLFWGENVGRVVEEIALQLVHTCLFITDRLLWALSEAHKVFELRTTSGCSTQDNVYRNLLIFRSVLVKEKFIYDKFASSYENAYAQVSKIEPSAQIEEFVFT